MARDRLVGNRRSDEDVNGRVGCGARRFTFDSHRRPPPVMTSATPPTRGVSEGTRLPHAGWGSPEVSVVSRNSRSRPTTTGPRMSELRAEAKWLEAEAEDRRAEAARAREKRALRMEQESPRRGSQSTRLLQGRGRGSALVEADRDDEIPELMDLLRETSTNGNWTRKRERGCMASRGSSMRDGTMRSTTTWNVATGLRCGGIRSMSTGRMPRRSSNCWWSGRQRTRK